MTDLKTRYLGFCPICEGDFKLRDNKVVHHGFTRPGDGNIHGDCFAVHELPYELSDHSCKLYQESCISLKANAEAHLARLKAGQIKTFSVPDHSKGYSRFPPMMEITVIHLAFRQAWESAIYQTEGNIRTLTFEIERMQKYIDTWVLKTVRTFEEEMEKKRAETAARKAEKEALRAAKRAKTAKTRERQDRFAAEKKALMDRYRETFLALVAQPFNPNTVGLEAKAAYGKMRKEQGKKGYLNFYPRDLEIQDQVWVDLGLATWQERGSTPWLSFNNY